MFPRTDYPDPQMFKLLELLEQLVRPLELAEYLGHATRHEGQHFVMSCPYCQADLWIMSDGYLCTNSACTMLAGSVIELASSKTKSFQDGLTTIWSLFHARLMHCPDFTADTFARDLAPLARQRRKLFSMLRRLHNPEDMSVQRSAILAGLQQQGIHDPYHQMVGVLLPDEQATFLDTLREAGVETPKLPSAPLLLIPYWVRPHDLGAIVLQHPRAAWGTTIKVQDYGVALAGLQMMTPAVKTVYLHDTAVAAGVQNSKWALRDPSNLSLTYLLDTDPVAPPALSDVVMVHSRDTSHTMIARMQKAYPDLQVADASAQNVRSFDRHLFEVLQSCIRGNSLNSMGLVVLGSYNPQGEVKQSLHRQLRSAGLVGAADQVSRTLYNVEISRTERMSIHETPEGYGCRRLPAGHLELFSNFIVRVTSNVTFGENSSPHHKVTILLDNEQYDTVISTLLLDNPRDLQEFVQRLASLSKSHVVPMLRDPATFRNVAYYLRGLLPRLPVEPGLPFLGWSFNRDTWYMPGRVVSMDKLQEGSFCLHPDVAALRSFTDAPDVQDSVRPDLPVELQTYILMILGSIIRGFRKEQLQAVQIRHDGNAVRMLSGLFRGMGQSQAVPKIERDPTGLQQYPAWGIAGKVMGKLKYPWFLLTTNGRSVGGPYSDSVLADAASTLRGLVLRVTEALLAQPDPNDWTPQPFVLYGNGLAELAQKFCAEHCGVRLLADLPSFEWVEKMLHQIPKEEVGKHVSYDFANQRVFCNLSQFTDLDLPCLEIELRQLSEHVTVHTGLRVELDAYSAFNLLESFYGSPPELPAVVRDQ